MRALEIVAESWPIAVMLVAIVAGFVVWSIARRSMKNWMVLEQDRIKGTNAVVVQPRHHPAD